jgi:hypothetical protein
MSNRDPQNRPDLDDGEREMTSADFTAADPEHGQESEPSQQQHHNAETDEDTASGGSPD